MTAPPEKPPPGEMLPFRIMYTPNMQMSGNRNLLRDDRIRSSPWSLIISS